MRGFRIFILLLGCAFSPGLQAQPMEQDTTRIDSMSLEELRRKNPFIDSLLTDSLKSALANKFKIQIPKTKKGKVIDRFDPYGQEIFLRKGLGKFWFFLVSLCILGLVLYFRNAFPNQLILRLRSLINGYYFRELVAEMGISFTSGSVVAGIISTLILSQAIVVIVVYSGFVNLNSFIFYLLVVVLVSIWKTGLFFIQRLQSFVLDISEIARNQTQRQINIDFGISLFLFPLIAFSYFNSSLLSDVDVALIMGVAITIWISLRVILEFLGLFREGGFSFSGILYFCGFEILPHAVLLTALFRMYSA